MTMELAGETRSDARMETAEGPRATGTSRPGGLSYGIASNYETPSLNSARLRHLMLIRFRRAALKILAMQAIFLHSVLQFSARNP